MSALPQERIMATLREIGPQIEVPRTAALYAPLQPAEPYVGVSVARDLAYGPHERHRLDVFTVAHEPALRPVMVYVHGGGFRMGAKNAPGSPFHDNVGVWAVRHGLVGVTINYRLAPEFRYPAGAEDVARVIEWLQAQAPQFGGDPRRIFLWGHSAGGAHVATYIAHAATPAVAGAILLSGIYDIEDGDQVSRWQDYYGADVAQYRAMSPVPALVRSQLPLLVAWAELDREDFAVDAEKLVRACAAAGRRIRTLRLAGHSHISEIYAVGTGDTSLTAPVLEFITTGGSTT